MIKDYLKLQYDRLDIKDLYFPHRLQGSDNLINVGFKKLKNQCILCGHIISSLFRVKVILIHLPSYSMLIS